MIYVDGSIWHAWEGGPGNYIGEHMWIGEDVLLEHKRKVVYDDKPNVLSDDSGSLAKLAFVDALEEARARINSTQPEDEPEVEDETNFSHIIIAISSKAKTDNLDHINFFKVIENSSGKRYMFEYALDVIQTSLGPRQRG